MHKVHQVDDLVVVSVQFKRHKLSNVEQCGVVVRKMMRKENGKAGVDAVQASTNTASVDAESGQPASRFPSASPNHARNRRIMNLMSFVTNKRDKIPLSPKPGPEGAGAPDQREWGGVRREGRGPRRSGGRGGGPRPTHLVKGACPNGARFRPPQSNNEGRQAATD